MIRSSKHTLKFSNQEKLNQVNRLYEDYKIDFQHYIDCILRGYLPLKLNLSSKQLPSNRLEHSEFKQIIYKQASSLVRSTLQSQRRIKRDKSLQADYNASRNILLRGDSLLSASSIIPLPSNLIARDSL
jgi:hypothetical protein